MADVVQLLLDWMGVGARDIVTQARICASAAALCALVHAKMHHKRKSFHVRCAGLPLQRPMASGHTVSNLCLSRSHSYGAE